MPAREALPPEAVARQDNGPPCRRCHGHTWDVERRPKGWARRWVETIIAAPDVWIFQGDSGGWPNKHYELWTCRNCGRRARV